MSTNLKYYWYWINAAVAHPIFCGLMFWQLVITHENLYIRTLWHIKQYIWKTIIYKPFLQKQLASLALSAKLNHDDNETTGKSVLH